MLCRRDWGKRIRKKGFVDVWYSTTFFFKKNLSSLKDMGGVRHIEIINLLVRVEFTISHIGVADESRIYDFTSESRICDLTYECMKLTYSN